MSELVNTRRRTIHWELLTTVSALALLASACDVEQARAEENASDRPAIWIELGAQLEQVSGLGDPFSPPFTHEIIADGFTSPLEPQRALNQSFGSESTISFQPENSDLIFSVSVRYGRTSGHKEAHDKTPGGSRHITVATPSGNHTGSLDLPNTKFSETRATNNETHAIVDFQVGKDLGLGLFNAGGASRLYVGVRFAQFASKQVLNINADPDFYFPKPLNEENAKYHHTYAVTSHMERSFRGFGPSLSWNALAPLIGHTDVGEIALNWGVNAAVLFGRQKVSGHHQTTAGFYKTNELRSGYRFASHFQHSGNPDRSHTVFVPNLGGFAGVSYLFTNAKLSVGYRADFFMGAVDGGIDAPESKNMGFFGPFATISIGFP